MQDTVTTEIAKLQNYQKNITLVFIVFRELETVRTKEGDMVRT